MEVCKHASTTLKATQTSYPILGKAMVDAVVEMTVRTDKAPTHVRRLYHHATYIATDEQQT